MEWEGVFTAHFLKFLSCDCITYIKIKLKKTLNIRFSLLFFLFKEMLPLQII